MTIEEAVIVLNERRHRGYDDWTTSRIRRLAMARLNHGLGHEVFLEGFEAIAIAEKYLEEEQP